MTESQKHRVMDIRKGSRKGQKKGRTGCKTCKARRVKCDEATPVCGRCTKSGRVCVGNLPKVSESKIISILPRPHQRIESTSLGTYQPSMTLSLNVEESCYIQFFHHEAMLGLFGLFNADFWTADLMQQCYTKPAIRHAIVAVGALVRSQETDCNKVGDIARCHQKFALRQYSKAISLLRETLATETAPESCLRTATTSCILFVCFEIFYGNKAQALQQLYHAARLITSYCSVLWHSTPKPGSVYESKSIQVFRRFLNKAKLWDVIFRRYDCHWLPHALTRREHEREILHNMPVAFGDIKEASDYYELYTQYLASSILYYYQSQGHNKETPIDPFLGDQLRQSAFDIDDKLKAAIEPLLLQAMSSSESDPNFLILIKIIFWRQRLYRIILELEFGRSEMWFDTVTPMIEEALGITSTLKEIFEKPTANPSSWKSTKSVVSFKFGTWVTYTLFSIAMKCRVGGIRENVISWLSSIPSGGLGDCSAAGKVALAISELEGKADGDEVIPREKRVTIKMVVLNDAKPTADVIYLTHEGIEKSLDVKL